MSAILTSPWTSFLLRKAGEAFVAVAALTLLTFLLVQFVPGDPARVAAGVEASTEQVEVIRQELGLTLPLHEQLYRYVGGLLTGDMGTSFRTGEAVTEIVGVRLPYTTSVALSAIVLALVLAIVMGLTVAGLTRGNRRRWLDVSFSWATAAFQTLPVYVLGALLVVVFAVTLRVLPAAGANSPGSYVLPTVALALGPACAIGRVVRREAANVLEQDYMRTARGWRISPAKQYLRYALPNLLTSTLTLSGLVLAGMLGGAVVMESVFAWPGLGNGVVEAILEKDYPVMRGIILTLGVIATLLHLTIDIVLALVDPRTMHSKKVRS